jgi:hypothetical protein
MSDTNSSPGLCHNCGVRSIAPGRRKYCAVCGPRATKIWKQNFRAKCRRDGVSYCDWTDDEKRRAYFRKYMAAWRARLRSDPPTPGGGAR